LKVTITAGDLTRGQLNERSVLIATANFFTDTWAASTPTNASYRVDRINDASDEAQELLGWTALTPATSVAITITAAQNAIQCDYERVERRQLTVKADDGLATQTQQVLRYGVKNLAGQV
jgi:hypothetical protein